MHIIDDKDKNFYKKYGYLLIKNFFNQKHIFKLKSKVLKYKKPTLNEKVHKYYEKNILNKRKQVLVRIENLYENDKTIKDLINSKIIKKNLKKLLGTDSILFKEKINFKSPGTRADKLHQDSQAKWWKYTNEFVSVIISLQDSDKNNGPLQVDISGNNHKKLINRKQKPLEIKELKNPKMKIIELKTKDALFFNSFIPHQSKPNKSNKGRAQLYVTFNKKSDGNFRKIYLEDKLKNFPPNNLRQTNKKYSYKV
tara:strand:+ start:73 stop:831 length:759 start_codon:yes stop_codon:yes gene_type:complete